MDGARAMWGGIPRLNNHVYNLWCSLCSSWACVLGHPPRRVVRALGAGFRKPSSRCGGDLAFPPDPRRLRLRDAEHVCTVPWSLEEAWTASSSSPAVAPTWQCCAQALVMEEGVRVWRVVVSLIHSPAFGFGFQKESMPLTYPST